MRRKYAESTKYSLQQSIKPTMAPLAVAISGALTAGSLQAAERNQDRQVLATGVGLPTSMQSPISV